MFGRRRETVNLNTLERSTIGAPRAGSPEASPEAMPALLRAASARLPWRTRIGFWCVPPRCIACGGEGEVGAVDLCAACLAAWPHRLPNASVAPPALRGAQWLVAFDYLEPVAGALRALKFDGDLRCARVLGALLAMRSLGHDVVRPDAIVPVALHATRLRERGYDQAALIAQHVGSWLQIPVRHWLRRTRLTAPQTELDAVSRRDNLNNAFAADTAEMREFFVVDADPQNRALTIAVLDDVLTTGATLAAARDALHAAASVAGVPLELQFWAVAATTKSSAMPTNTSNPT